MSTYSLASTVYLEARPDDMVCYIHQFDWAARIQESARLFAILTFDEDTTRICAVDHTLTHEIPLDAENPIFVPLWLIPPEVVMGTPIHVEFFTQDAFPEASRIVLKPLDSAFYNTDAKEMLTASLSRLGVLRKGDTILLKLEELGGYEMGFYVSELEPADVVLLNAEEVVMEFEEAADQWDGRRPPTPVSEEVNMIIPEPPATTPGVVLGGGPVRRMADGRPWNPYR
jgi:hypothetical protein